MQSKAEYILHNLLNHTISNPGILPAEVEERANNSDFQQTIYKDIAGIADRNTFDEHSRLFDPKFTS